MVKNKINKITFGLLIFMFASINVFADTCNNGKPIIKEGEKTADCEKVCSEISYNGYKCMQKTFSASWITNSQGKKVVETKCYCKTSNIKANTEFKITFNGNGGTINGQTTKVYKCNSDICTYATPNVTKSNSTFKGWSLTKSCDSIEVSPTSGNGVMCDKAMTYYACWGNSNYPSCGDKSSSIYNTKWEGKDHCNNTKDTNWRTDWSSSNNCCYITKREKQQSGGTQTTNDKYTITFDQNGGYGLGCGSDLTYVKDGVCKKSELSSGTSVNFPTMSASMYNSDGLLIGWSKNTSCEQTEIKKISEGSYKVTSDITLYACYKEVIGANRVLVDGYVADGGSIDYKCGQSIKIEYCVKETSGNYCFYKDSNGNLRKIYRDKLASSESGALAQCSKNSSNAKNKYMYATNNGKNYVCGEALYITSCNDTECSYNKILKFDGSEIIDNNTINIKYLVDNTNDSRKACEKVTEVKDDFENLKKCDNDQVIIATGKDTYSNFCYKKDYTEKEFYEEFNKVFDCFEGYTLDKESIYNLDEKETCNKQHGICINNFSATCKPNNSEIPTLSVSSGIAQNGYGVITVKAKAKVGKIEQYYYSEDYLEPTSDDEWIDTDSDTFTIKETPGIKYIWVKDSYGNVSNVVRGAVLDTVTVDTTVNEFSVYDEKGKLKSLTSVAYDTDNFESSNYVRLSNNLIKDSKVLAESFNPFDMEYKLEVDSPTVTVYATLTSSDSNYVEGYEPRTVNLNYGINTVLIKIRNKEGITRTYTILVTRKDTRTSYNTLNDVKLSVGEINFNANVTDYKVEIPSSTKEVKIDSTIASDKASYVDNYLPGNVTITGDTTVKLIKVKSQTGSTRTYVFTFIKEGTDTIDNSSLQISRLAIPDVYVPFESDISNYSLSVGYSTNIIDIRPTLNDENSSYSVRVKKKNDSDYSISSNTGIGLDVGENFIEIIVEDNTGDTSYYRFTIIRKEFGLEVSNDKSLKDLKVLGYDIEFKPEKKDYTVKIKQEKSLVITAVPNNNRAEVLIRGNDELTGFSTVRIKVMAENGEYETYSIDIKKDAYNKVLEIAAIVVGAVIILGSSCIIVIKNKNKKNKEYFEE